MSEEKEENNIVFIGVKPFMNYVTSVVMLFTSKNKDEIIIKARGRWISRAVEVAEIVRKKFLKEQNIQVKDIKIDSTEIENDEGRKVNVATIEITLKK